MYGENVHLEMLPMATSPATSSLTKVSDEAIQRGTGKMWSEWIALLDAWGAADRTHADIARYVHEEHGVDGWWAQAVTVGYERATGRREVGQKCDGSYAASASKTVPVPVESLFAAWVDEARRDLWLAPGTLSLRTAQDARSARFDDLEYGGIVALWFEARGPGKASVGVQIEKLPSQDAVVERKAVWKARLAHLADYVKNA